MMPEIVDKKIKACLKILSFSIILFVLLILNRPLLYSNEVIKIKPDLNNMSVAFIEGQGKEQNMEETDRLTEKEGEYLLYVARRTIEEKLFGRMGPSLKGTEHSKKYMEKRGTFVTITIHDSLRGCIGHIIPQETLIEGIRINSLNAAFQDPRFPPLSRQEWDNIKIEISILTEPKVLTYSDSADLLNKLNPGVDGVIIKKGFRQATFLPQVWEQLPDKEEFLMHLCMKAGLDEYAWKDKKLDVSVYQVQAFEEQD